MSEECVVCTGDTEVGQAVVSGVAALPVDLTEMVAGTGAGVAGVDDFFNDVLEGAGSCGKRNGMSDIREHRAQR